MKVPAALRNFLDGLLILAAITTTSVAVFVVVYAFTNGWNPQ